MRTFERTAGRPVAFPARGERLRRSSPRPRPPAFRRPASRSAPARPRSALRERAVVRQLRRSSPTAAGPVSPRAAAIATPVSAICASIASNQARPAIPRRAAGCARASPSRSRACAVRGRDRSPAPAGRGSAAGRRPVRRTAHPSPASARARAAIRADPRRSCALAPLMRTRRPASAPPFRRRPCRCRCRMSPSAARRVAHRPQSRRRSLARHLLIGGAPQPAARRQEGDRLQKVGFAGAVLAGEARRGRARDRATSEA